MENNQISVNETIELLNTIPPQDIFAFNELRSCADLKRMYDKKQLDLSPNFQREQVWNKAAQTRFLDSLLKNLPIPSMCFSQDTESGKRIVIDGLQRISTIVKFLTSAEKKETFILSALDDIDERLSGKDVTKIAEENPEIIEAIENVTIPITVLRSNFSKLEHMEYIFTIFHRLNTGGTRLNAQEIRNCIFSGNFNDLLFECAEKFPEELNQLIGTTDNKRFTHEEFILRFFAFYDKSNDYTSQLTRFLNIYMKENRNLTEYNLDIKKKLFTDSLLVIRNNFININIGSKIIAEALLYGIAHNIDTLRNKTTDFFIQAFEEMKGLPAFSEQELNSSTANTSKVQARLEAAKAVFGNKG